MALEDQLLTILINYGLAGIVIYMFYVLLRNELSELRQSIERLTEKVNELSNRIEKLITLIERGEKK
jgi:uncharacterized membrane protein YciS (DUF1049 family)